MPLVVRPDLVVMMMAPFAARDPYNAVAAGPFSTDTFSMSSGLMSPAALPKSTAPSVELYALSDVLEVVLLVMGTPSTTNRAVPPFMLMDVSPRRVTRIDPPGPVDA